jgi:predicted PurR-regulated permease PerM
LDGSQPDADETLDSSNSSDERLLAYVGVLVGLAVVVVLWWGRAVWVPLVLSVLISYALEPVVAFLGRHGVRRALGVPLLLVALSITFGSGAYLLRGEAGDFINGLPNTAHTLAEAIRGLTRGGPGTVSKVQAAARELESAASGAVTRGTREGVTAVRIEQPTFRWSEWLWQGSYGALAFVGQMFAVVCLVYYLLAAGDMYKRKLVRIVPTLSHKKVTLDILAEIDRQIERFLLARVVISVIVGIMIWISFGLLGLNQAGVWGVLSAVLFAIPIVGPILLVGAAAAAAFVQFGSLGMVVGVAGTSVAVGALEGNVLTPWLMSRAGEMNAVAVFVSLLFWGWLWGAWGLLLAVPITAALKAVCERVPDFSAVAELLKE